MSKNSIYDRKDTIREPLSLFVEWRRVSRFVESIIVTVPSAQVQADDTNCFGLPFRLSPFFKRALKETCQLVEKLSLKLANRTSPPLADFFFFSPAATICLLVILQVGGSFTQWRGG